MKNKRKEKLRKKYFYALGIAKFEGEYGQDIEQDSFPEFIVDEIIEETRKEVLEKIEIHCLKKYGPIAGLKIFKELKEELKLELKND